MISYDIILNVSNFLKWKLECLNKCTVFTNKLFYYSVFIYFLSYGRVNHPQNIFFAYHTENILYVDISLQNSNEASCKELKEKSFSAL